MPGENVVSELAEAMRALYAVFDGYPRPAQISICPTCAYRGIDPARLASAPLRQWSGGDLVAIHALSLPDDELRHFLPRVFEVLLSKDWAAFEFGLGMFGGRVAGWPPAERDAIAHLLTAAWETVVSSYPVRLGYIASAPDVLELAQLVDLPISGLLHVLDDCHKPTAQMHLAELVEFAYTTSDTVEIVGPLRAWLARPIVGQRLEEAFYLTDDNTWQRTLADAHALWETCAPTPPS